MINPHKYCNKASVPNCIPREEKVRLELPDCTCVKGIRKIECVPCPPENGAARGPCKFEPKITLLICATGEEAPECTTVVSDKPNYSVC